VVPRASVRDRGERRDPRLDDRAGDLADFDGKRLDYFVTGYGTGGTLTGVGRVLRAERSGVKFVVSKPANAALLTSGKPQTRNEAHEPAEGPPAFEPHPIQGWTPDFIPWALQEAVDKEFIDELIPIPGPVAIEWSRKLAQRKGIFTGISGGATFAVAKRVAERAPAGYEMPYVSGPPGRLSTSGRCHRSELPV
jgi:cysteine synthase A